MYGRRGVPESNVTQPSLLPPTQCWFWPGTQWVSTCLITLSRPRYIRACGLGMREQLEKQLGGCRASLLPVRDALRASGQSAESGGGNVTDGPRHVCSVPKPVPN